MAATPDGGGYWLVASDGGIFCYGDATFYGSTGNIHLNQPIVGMAATPDGGGYWLVASDGGIFSYGDAQFYGSTGTIHLNQPIVGMAGGAGRERLLARRRRRRHLQLRTSPFFGSTGGSKLNAPIVGMAATAAGTGSLPRTAASSTSGRSVPRRHGGPGRAPTRSGPLRPRHRARASGSCPPVPRRAAHRATRLGRAGGGLPADAAVRTRLLGRHHGRLVRRQHAAGGVGAAEGGQPPP